MAPQTFGIRDGESLCITRADHKLHVSRMGDKLYYVAWLDMPSLLDVLARAAANQLFDSVNCYAGERLPAELDGHYEFIKV